MTKCLLKYCEAPTYISSRIADQWEADFPAITVCPHNGGLKSDVLRVRISCALTCGLWKWENEFIFKGTWDIKS